MGEGSGWNSGGEEEEVEGREERERERLVVEGVTD